MNSTTLTIPAIKASLSEAIRQKDITDRKIKDIRGLLDIRTGVSKPSTNGHSPDSQPPRPTKRRPHSSSRRPDSRDQTRKALRSLVPHVENWVQRADICAMLNQSGYEDFEDYTKDDVSQLLTEMAKEGVICRIRVGENGKVYLYGRPQWTIKYGNTRTFVFDAPRPNPALVGNKTLVFLCGPN